MLFSLVASLTSWIVQFVGLTKLPPPQTLQQCALQVAVSASFTCSRVSVARAPVLRSRSFDSPSAA